MNYKLLLLTLITAPSALELKAMFNPKTAVNVDEAAQRAQDIAARLRAGQPVPTTEVTGAIPVTTVIAERKATVAEYFEQLPEDLLEKVKSRYMSAKFMRHAATLRIELPANYNVYITCTNGKQILTTLDKSGYGALLNLYDIATGTLMSTSFVPYAYQLDLALSENYKVISTRRDDKAQIEIHHTNGSTFTLSHFLAENDYVNTITISENERYIAIENAARNVENTTIFIFEKQEGNSWKLLHTFANHFRSGPPSQLLFSRDTNPFLMIGSRKTLQAIDLATGICTSTFTIDSPDGIGAYSLSHDNTQAIIGTHNGRVLVYKICSGKPLQIIPAPTPTNNAIYMINILPNGNYITGDEMGNQYRWSQETGALLQTVPHDNSFSQYALNHYSSDYTIIRENRTGNNAPITVKLNPDIIKKLPLDLLQFISELIKTRDAQIQKDPKKLLNLTDEQITKFKTLPLFVQTALRQNLNLDIPETPAPAKVSTDKGDAKQN